MATFDTDFIQNEILDENPEYFIKKQFLSKSRWALHYDLIFTFEGKFYACRYSRPATEMQDSDPFPDQRYGTQMIECREVQPHQEIITVYR